MVLEKCLAVGLGGIVSDGVRKSLSGIQLKGYTVIAGLGGRAITRASLRQLFADAIAEPAPGDHFATLAHLIAAIEDGATRLERKIALELPEGEADIGDHGDPAGERSGFGAGYGIGVGQLRLGLCKRWLWRRLKHVNLAGRHLCNRQ